MSASDLLGTPTVTLADRETETYELRNKLQLRGPAQERWAGSNTTSPQRYTPVNTQGKIGITLSKAFKVEKQGDGQISSSSALF